MFDPLIVKALLASLAIAVIAGPLGCFVIWRRMAFFGATVAHGGLLGVTMAMILGINVQLGVLAMALLTAVVTLVWLRSGALPSDSILSILAHVTLAIGLLAISLWSGGIQIDLNSYLFGDILLLGWSDLYIVLGGSMMLGGLLLYFWRPLIAISVQPEIAAVEGVPVELMNWIVTLLIAMTVGIAMKLVGLLLIAALLVIPASAARVLARGPEQMALYASGIAIIACSGGVWASFALDLPAGPAIVVLLGGLVALTNLAVRLRAAAGRSAG